MITLIHGDDTTKVQNKLVEIEEKDVPKANFDLKNDTPEEIYDSLVTESLFAEKKIIVVRNIKALHHTKRKKLFEKLKEYKSDKYTHVILIQNGVLEGKLITQVPTDNTFAYTLPKYFFEFLDGLVPKKAQSITRILAQLDTEGGEQLLFAALSRVRLLLLFKTPEPLQFDDVKKAAPFYRSKLQAQSKKWQEGELFLFYKDLQSIEVGLKTSNLPLGVAKSLDITVFKHLN